MPNETDSPESSKAIEPIHPDREGFAERVTPKPPDDNVHFFKCKCGGIHFRHAGYIKSLLPFMRAGGEKRVNVEQLCVQVCVKCRKSYVWLNEQMYEVTNQVDLNAWEKSERELHRATGPGGQC